VHRTLVDSESIRVTNVVARYTDVLIVLFTALISYHSYELPPLISTNYIVSIAFVILLTLLIFSSASLYKDWVRASLQEEIKRVSFAWTAAFFILVLAIFLTKSSEEISRGWMLIWFLSGLIWLTLGRVFLRRAELWFYKRGMGKKNVVVAGLPDLAEMVKDRLTLREFLGINVTAVLVPDDNPELTSGEHVKYATFSDMERLISEDDVTEVWITLPLNQEALLQDLTKRLQTLAISIRYVPDLFGMSLLNHSVTEVAGLPVLNLSVSPMSGFNRILKAVEDYILSSLILLAAGPLMLAISILVKLSSKGPVLFRQVRVGWNGQNFTMYKFRSMPVDVENETGPVWAKKGEERATWIGGILRKTSLDELPQFINVLKGEMSIVGPRPERPKFVERFKNEIPGYMKKHLVKAGITGWAQVNGLRGDTDLEKRIEYDLYYIENWSVWFDLKIILLTLFKGFLNKHAY